MGGLRGPVRAGAGRALPRAPGPAGMKGRGEAGRWEGVGTFRIPCRPWERRVASLSWNGGFPQSFPNEVDLCRTRRSRKSS